MTEGFVPIAEAVKHMGIKTLAWGPPGIGKSYFALTCPPPIRVISTEGGISQLYKQFEGKDIQVMECSEPYTEALVQQGEKDTDPFSVDPVVSLEKIDAATMALKDVTDGTIIVDSISDIWEWMGIWLKAKAKMHQAASGSEYMMRTDWQEANARYKWLLSRIISRPVHVVLTARHQQVYDQSGNVTAQTKPQAQKNTEFWCDIVTKMTMSSGMSVVDGKAVKGKPTRIAEITKCRQNGSMVGEKIQDLTFDKLKALLKDHVPEEVFT